MNPQLIVQIAPLALITVVFGTTAYLLAKQKGRNVAVWTILGCLPIINVLAMTYFIGATKRE